VCDLETSRDSPLWAVSQKTKKKLIFYFNLIS